MADTKHTSASSDDDVKSYPVEDNTTQLRAPEAVAAEYNLSEKKLLRKLDLYLVPGVAVSRNEWSSTLYTELQS